MADWNKPTITSDYLDFVTEMHAKFTDAAQMFGVQSAQNFPIGTLRFNRSGNIFDEWDGSTFQPKVLGVAGGGTGSNNPAGIRTNLGLGSMSTQNANAVAITGGSIVGVTYSASDITTGIMPLARGGTGNSLAIGTPGTILMSNGAVVYFDTGINISQLNASTLVAGTVPFDRFPANNAWNDRSQAFQGRQHFYGEFIAMAPTGIFNATSYTPNPAYNLYDYSAGAGAKIVRTILVGGNYEVQKVDDAYTYATGLGYWRTDGFLVTDGRLITNTNGYNITHGYINPVVLGTGAANSSTFLRGDQTWAVPTGGGGGGAPIPFPSGMISMFANGCPAGWTRVAQFDNRFPMGANSYGQQGGGQRHSHSFSVNSTQEGGHSHSFWAGVSGRAKGNVSGTVGGSSQQETADGGSARVLAAQGHVHDFNVYANLAIEEASASGETSGVGNHSHQVYGETSEADFYPPYTAVFFCQKD